MNAVGHRTAILLVDVMHANHHRRSTVRKVQIKCKHFITNRYDGKYKNSRTFRRTLGKNNKKTPCAALNQPEVVAGSNNLFLLIYTLPSVYYWTVGIEFHIKRCIETKTSVRRYFPHHLKDRRMTNESCIIENYWIVWYNARIPNECHSSSNI